jgi:hypothetical protein
MRIIFQVTVSYQAEILYATPDVVSAIRFAAAAAMHSGKVFHVHRSVVSSTVSSTAESRYQLLSVMPSSIDFRRVSPETVLGTKALAHELWEAIDTSMNFKPEGFDE